MGKKGAYRLQKISDGGTIGELGFFLKKPQIFGAKAVTNCRLFRLCRDDLARMALENPQLCVLLQSVLLNSICLMTCDNISSKHYHT